jgi:hypothetical protein
MFMPSPGRINTHPRIATEVLPRPRIERSGLRGSRKTRIPFELSSTKGVRQ